MADFKRVQIIAAPPNALARDKVVNTVHFKRAESAVGTFSDQDMADDIKEFIATKWTFYAGCTTVEVRVYDLEDAPGPPTAVSTGAFGGSVANAGPREVALCLSFRGADNTPRTRGRIFLGPINASSVRPDGGLRGDALAFATAFANIGGINEDWCVFSPSSVGPGGELGPAFHPVKHAWVDDEWDTMRSRGYRATTRSTLDLDE